MKETFLKVKDLEVIYKTDLETVYAVNGISFDLAKGETLGLVGETGAGKTTTALSILRLLPERTAQIKGGDIQLEGKSLLSLPEKEMQRIPGRKDLYDLPGSHDRAESGADRRRPDRGSLCSSTTM